MKILIHLYQLTKPVRHAFYSSIGLNPHPCRHTPSCSQKALQLIGKHGNLRGSLFALKQILSCHPHPSSPPTIA